MWIIQNEEIVKTFPNINLLEKRKTHNYYNSCFFFINLSATWTCAVLITGNKYQCNSYTESQSRSRLIFVTKISTVMCMFYIELRVPIKNLQKPKYSWTKHYADSDICWLSINETLIQPWVNRMSHQHLTILYIELSCLNTRPKRKSAKFCGENHYNYH